MRKGNSGEIGEEKTDENSGNYVIASSPLPERRLLEGRTLVPMQLNWKILKKMYLLKTKFDILHFAANVFKEKKIFMSELIKLYNTKHKQLTTQSP